MSNDQVRTVATIFNDMADEYDHLEDLWYRYSFSVIDDALRQHVGGAARGGELAVDIGCGTGIQTERLASLGFDVVGIDIARDLLNTASQRAFTEGRRVSFIEGDAQAVPVADSVARVVNCCGPTLSFVPDWGAAISEMGRVLQPGGRLLLEVEGKWNLDLAWALLSSLLGDPFGYEQTPREAIRGFLPPFGLGHWITYAFELEDGTTVPMKLKLFSYTELKAELAAVGLRVSQCWGVHSLTNIIPSPVLHSAHPSHFVRRLFTGLAAVERKTNRRWPLQRMGCSLLVLAEKQ